MKGISRVFIIMGVSGCGKSTIGNMLATVLKLPFFDGDDYHSAENVLKMSKGNPLNDEDRLSWLQRLNTLAKEHIDSGSVIACSALKEKYRSILSKDIEDRTRFIYLKGSFEELTKRMTLRTDHFMPPGLLKSQFETLETPKDALTVSTENPPEIIVDNILKHLEKL